MRTVVALALLGLLGLAHGFDMGSMGMGMGGKKMGEKKAAARKEDIQYIRCQVCETFVKQAIKTVKTLREAEKPGKKVTEADIIDKLETMCNTDKEAGEWITQIDLQEEDDKLKLVDMGQVGNCGVECATVARTCNQISESLDLSDLSEMLFKKTKRSTINNWACYEQSGACSKKTPPLSKARPNGEAFQPLGEDEARNKKLMRTMKEAGLSGTMYDRESMMAQMGAEKGEDDDDDEGANPGPISGGEL